MCNCGCAADCFADTEAGAAECSAFCQRAACEPRSNDLGQSTAAGHASADCPEEGEDYPFPSPQPVQTIEGTAPGATHGTFTVSENGDASYRIPIVVPPGRLGLEPRLAISFDSSRGIGSLGKGFAVTGLSSIERCGSNLTQDGDVQGVRYDATDHFCLDGMRLVPIANGANEYRTFPDTFRKVVADPTSNADAGPPKFTVFEPNGRIAEYAITTKVANNQRHGSWLLSSVRDRHDNRVSYQYGMSVDAQGNTVEHWPSRIDYTSSPQLPADRSVIFHYDPLTKPAGSPVQPLGQTQGVLPLLNQWGFEAGHARANTKLLTLIETSVNVSGSPVVVRSYAFEYHPSKTTTWPLLDAVRECAHGSCKVPTRFGWNDDGHVGLGQSASGPRIATVTGMPENDCGAMATQTLNADVTGDGLPDLIVSTAKGCTTDEDRRTNVWYVARNQGNGAFDQWRKWAEFPYPSFDWVIHQPFYFLNIWGTLVDFLGIVRPIDFAELMVPNGVNTSCIGPFCMGSYIEIGKGPTYDITPIDVNQDGFMDLVLNRSNGLFPGENCTPSPINGNPICQPSAFHYLLSSPTVDTEGNVLPPESFALRNLGPFQYALSDASAEWQSSLRLPFEFFHAIKFGDINGDGVADLIECVDPNGGYGDQPGHPLPICVSPVDCERGHCTESGTPIVCSNPADQWRIYLWSPTGGQGGGPGYSADHYITPPWQFPCGYARGLLHVSDIDADGKAEVIGPSASGVTQTAFPHLAFDVGTGRPVVVSAGSTLPGALVAFRFKESTQTWSSRDTHLPMQVGANLPVVMADVNGDGFVDRVYPWGMEKLWANDNDALSRLAHATHYPSPSYPLTWGDYAWWMPTAWNNPYPPDVPFVNLNLGDGTFADAVPITASSLPGSETQPGGCLNCSIGPFSRWNIANFAAAMQADINGDGTVDLMYPMRDAHSPVTAWLHGILPSFAGYAVGGPAVVPTPETAYWAVYFGLPQNTYGGTSSSSPRYAKNVSQLSDFETTNLPLSPGLPPPQLADFDGDGRVDLLSYKSFSAAANAGTFSLYLSEAPRDRLIEITDGMNVMDRTDPGAHPTIQIDYGTLIDKSHSPQAFPINALNREERTLYAPRWNAQNDCHYPRRCVVSSRAVVRAYYIEDGQGGIRSFALGYRDGRFDVRGRGWLGFGAIIHRELETGAGEIKLFDNRTKGTFDAYPFTGQIKESISWTMNAPSLLIKPKQLELRYQYHSPVQHVNWPGRDYFTIDTRTRSVHVETTATSAQPETAPHVGFVGLVTLALANDPLSMTGTSSGSILSDTSVEAIGWDDYGNTTTSRRATKDVDQLDVVSTVYENDPTSWIIKRPRFVQSCSTSSAGTGTPITLCPTQTIVYDNHGDATDSLSGDAGGDPQLVVRRHFDYDSFGNLTRSLAEDLFGHQRAMCATYDKASATFPYAIGNGAGHVERTQHLPHGPVSAEADINGLMTVHRYDAFDRETWRRDAKGRTTTTERMRLKVPWTTASGGQTPPYWRTQIVESVSGGDQRVVHLDGAGRTISTAVTGPNTLACSEASGNCSLAPVYQVDSYYDSVGRLIKRSLPYMFPDAFATRQFKEFVYDAAGREILTTGPANSISTTYSGLTAISTDGTSMHQAQSDAAGRPLLLTEPSGGTTTSFTYGPFGERWATNHGGSVTSQERDAAGRTRTQFSPDRGKTTMDYDGFGQLAELRDDNGRTFKYVYDAIGRLRLRTAPDGVTAWGYDAAPLGAFGTPALGFVSSVTNDVSDTRYYYTGLGQLLQMQTTMQTGGQSETFSMELGYDADARLSIVKYPSGKSVNGFGVTYQYDSRGHLASIKNQFQTEELWRLSSVNGWGAVAEELWAPSLSTNQVRKTKYDPTTRLVGAIESLSANGSQTLGYSYDAHGNLVTRTSGAGSSLLSEHFCYDALDRLTCSFVDDDPRSVSCAPNELTPPPTCSTAIEYFANGNIRRKSDVGDYTYDAARPHAVVAVGPSGGDTYGYDAVGNQISRPDTKIRYTSFDLPAQYERTKEDVLINLWYDGDRTRIRKSDGVTETSYFAGLYERTRDLATLHDVHRYFVSIGSMRLEVSKQVGQPDSVEYVLPDRLGSPDQVVRPDGTLIERRSFDAFGQERSPIDWKTPLAPTSALTHGFTEHESESSLGLINMKGRIYDPKLGRFLQVDPIITDPFSAQRWNSYSYVLNNPLKYTDPTGFSEDTSELTIIYDGPDAEMQRDMDAYWADGIDRETTYSNGKQLTCSDGGCTWSNPAPPATHEKDEADRNPEGQVGSRTLDAVAPAKPAEPPLWAQLLVVIVCGGECSTASAPTNEVEAKSAPRSLTTTQVALNGLESGQAVVDLRNTARLATSLGAAVAKGASGGLGALKAACKSGVCESSCFVAGTPVHTTTSTRGIEEIDVGDRVAPRPGVECSHQVSQRLYRIELEMPNPERAGDTVLITLLRDIEWVVSNGAAPGATIDVNLSELGYHGTASVNTVGLAEHVAEGAGCLVVSTYAHRNGTLRALTFSGEQNAIFATALHPFYSLDRQEWIHAIDLRHDERVQTEDGEARLLENGSYPGVYVVYNLEVEGAHTYLVGSSGLVVHNNGCDYDPTPLLKAKEAFAEAIKNAHAVRRAGKGVTETIAAIDSGAGSAMRMSEEFVATRVETVITLSRGAPVAQSERIVAAWAGQSYVLAVTADGAIKQGMRFVRDGGAVIIDLVDLVAK